MRLGIPVVGVTDMGRAVAFWSAALGLVASDHRRTADWVTMRYPDGSDRALGLQLS